jgi:hypothetical protein
VGREEEEENIYHKSVQKSALPETVFNLKKHISLYNLSHFCYKKAKQGIKQQSMLQFICTTTTTVIINHSWRCLYQFTHT